MEVPFEGRDHEPERQGLRLLKGHRRGGVVDATLDPPFSNGANQQRETPDTQHTLRNDKQ